MDDAAFEAQRARILKLIDRWHEPLGLRWWRKVEYEYWREPLPAVDGPKPSSTGFVSVAQANASWKYLDGKIKFDMQACADLPDDELEYVFVHECCHLLINEMRQCDRDDWLDHEERVCTQLGQAFRWVREFGRRDAEPAKKRRA